MLFGRWMILLIFCLTIHVSSAQSKIWTLSERTGIKGIQANFGPRFYINSVAFQAFPRQFIPHKDSTDFASNSFQSTHYTGTIEIIYAPFRLHHNTFLRNIELSLGLTHGYFEDFYIGSYYYNETASGYDKSEYQFIFQGNITTATLKGCFNLPIAHKTMGYSSLGYGFGISGGAQFSQYSQNDFHFIRQVDPNTGFTTTSRRQTASNKSVNILYHGNRFHQGILSVGLKHYLTCRVNVFGEYRLEYTRFIDPNNTALPIATHGFQIGFRLKFNPPEPENPDNEKKKQNAFW